MGSGWSDLHAHGFEMLWVSPALSLGLGLEVLETLCGERSENSLLARRALGWVSTMMGTGAVTRCRDSCKHSA